LGDKSLDAIRGCEVPKNVKPTVSLKSTGHRTTHIETHSPLFSADRRVRGKRQVFTSIAICLPSLDGFSMMEIGSGSLVPFSVEVLF